MTVEISKTASLPTAFGQFDIVSFKETESGLEHFVIFMGSVKNSEDVLLRVHSECLTGDVFSSLKCDCGEQLDASLELIAERKEGMIIYLRQEGRGIGLFNKVNAYALQDKGLNTIEANLELGFAIDLRHYDVVKIVLEHFNIQSVRLLSNNPEKSIALTDMGIAVTEILPLIVAHNEYSSDYLNIKKYQMNHKL